MIRVLHLRDTKKVCGPGKTILETVSRINRDEFELSIGLFLEQDEHNNVYMNTALDRGITVIPIRFRFRLDLFIIFQIIRIIKENKIDIVHSHEYKSDIIAFLVAKFHRIPIITTIHGWIANNLKGKMNIALGKRVLPKFDRVIAVSPKIHAELISMGVPEDRVVLIYNAIVSKNYEPGVYENNVLRKQFNLPQTAILIGNVGRLSPEKGQRDFLLAARELCHANRNIYCILIGDGPDREKLESLIQEYDLEKQMLFTGHVQDVRPLYQDLDITALTSHTEGFPNVILESLCMRTPVLATDVGGVADIVENGITGTLVPAKDIDGIRNGLAVLLEKPEFAKKMTTRGKQKVLDQFEFANRVQAIENLYRDVLAECKR